MRNQYKVLHFDGHKCSRIYVRLLTIAREDKVRFALDSGYRSIAEQWVLWHRYKAGRGPIAAFPGTSTHNKRGWKQGMDINALDGGVDRFIRWAATHGMTFRKTVPGEAWHINAIADYSDKIEALWESHHHKN